VVPVLIYPLAYTTWQAVDLRGEPPSAAELDAAADFRRADEDA
jgi:hypothetical protein